MGYAIRPCTTAWALALLHSPNWRQCEAAVKLSNPVNHPPSRDHVWSCPPAHAQVYAEVKQQVAGGIDYLLRKRETDPYADFVRRMAYENAAVPFGGKRRQAPTFNP